MKRIITIVLIICFALSLCACADSAGGALPATPTPMPDDTMTYPVEGGDEHDQFQLRPLNRLKELGEL